MTDEAKLSNTEQKVTRSEIFAGAAFLLSASSLIFTGGMIYGDVQRNTDDIREMKEKVDPALIDIAGMKSDLRFLVKAEERRQGITRDREGENFK